MLTTYLLDIVILLAAAVLLVPLFQAARLGAVPGFLAAGVLVGPSGLALIDQVEEIVHIAEIGVVLLLFVIGIELKPSRLWLMRRLVFGLGSLQVLLTGAVLCALGYFLLGLPLATTFLVGPALALSSTAFVLQILAEQKALHSAYGRASFAVLLLQDLAVVPLLVLVPLLAAKDLSIGGNIGLALLESLTILTLVLAVGRYLLHPLLHRVARTGSPEVFTASALLIVLGAALATEYAGLSMAMGAFLAGLLMSESAYRHQVIAEIQPLRGLLLGLFFMSMGLLFDVGLLVQRPIAAVIILAVLLTTKLLVLWPLARLFGLGARASGAVALVLAQSGEFALVLFALARQAELLTAARFQQLLLVVLLSMLITPGLARVARRLAMHSPSRKAEAKEETPEAAPVVIAGYGRVGRRVGEMLLQAGQPFVGLDSDPEVVRMQRADGKPVYFGYISQPGLLRSLGASEARIIIVTLNDPEAVRRLVTELREQYPNVHIFARGHNLETCRSLIQLGANAVVSENVEASLELSRMTMECIGTPEDQRVAVLEAFRRHYHDQILETPEDSGNAA